MSKGTRDHRYRHAAEAVYRTAWAITPEKLDEILAVLDRRIALPADDPVNVAAASAFDMMDDEDEPDYMVTESGVAVLSLRGIVSQRMNLFSRFSGGISTEQVARRFSKAVNDPAARAIVLDIDSPGGAVGGVAELGNLIYEARGAKPIVAVSNTQMASAAYWIGSAAGTIVASPSSNTGSIGVYMVHSERSKLDAAVGVSRSVIKAGKFKTIGNDVEPLSESARAKLQEFIDGAYEMFVSAVARNRGTTAERVRQGYGEGDTLWANDALSAGLVDRVASLAEVIEALGMSAKGVGRAAAMPTAPAPVADSSGAVPVLQKGVQLMDPRIMAALFARGLVTDQSAVGEPVAQMALKAYFAGQGKAVPEGTDAIVSGLMTQSAQPIPAVLKTSDPTPDASAIERAAKEAAAAERHRAATIRARAKILGVEAEGERLIEAGVADASAIDELFKAHTSKKGDNDLPDRIEAGQSAIDKFGAVAQEAVEAKLFMGVGQFEPFNKAKPESKQFARKRLLDIAAESLRMQGWNIGHLNSEQLAKVALGGVDAAQQLGVMASATGQAYYTTGSLPQLTLNASHKILQNAFQEAPVSYRQWVPTGEPIQDFKIQNVIKMSGASDLEEVPENAETPIDTGVSDAREYFAAGRFAKKIPFSFQMLVNDDLSALSRIPQLQGAAAARTWNKAVYNILTSNPTMADSYALFDATNHQGNLLSGTSEVPTVTSLSKLQAVLRKMKGLNTDITLSLSLRYLIVPAALEANAKSVIWSAADPATSNSQAVNIFGPGKYTIDPVIEPLLDASSAAYFYGAADPAFCRTIVVRFLAGQESPMLESWWDPDRASRIFLVSQSGAAVLEEYRGLVRDNGA